MDLGLVAELVQLAASLAVVGSLVFVGLQMRLSAIANRATALQMNADYWQSHLATLAERGNSAVYAKGASAHEPLSSEEFGRFFLLCRATFMGCENQHYQFRVGLIDSAAYAGYEMTIREQIAAFPGVRAMWALVRHSYGKEFAAFMDTQISRESAHQRSSAHERWSELVAAATEAK